MAKGQSDMKEKIARIMGVSKAAFYYGFIPTILLLGFLRGSDEGAPKVTLMSLLWQ